MTVQPAGSRADRAELEKFAALATEWWDPNGPLKTLHDINPLRVGYIEAHAPQLAAPPEATVGAASGPRPPPPPSEDFGSADPGVAAVAARRPLSPSRGLRVLDVGCGGGLLAEALARRGARVVGVDLAEASLTVARAHAAEQALAIDYRCASAQDVAAAEPGAFDVVTCLEVLEHVRDADAVVAACAAALRPGGTAFFSTINRNLKSLLLAIVGAEYVLGMVPRGTHEYLKLVRPAELAAWCRAAGLTLADLTGLHFNPLTRMYRLGGNVDVNYFACARKTGGE